MLDSIILDIYNKGVKFFCFTPLFIMEKDFRYIELFEIYKGLLTENQRDMFASHYIYDLSLSEIAEQENRSRQTIYDAIRKVKVKLDEYENLLRLKTINDNLLSVAKKLEGKDKELAEQILELIGR